MIYGFDTEIECQAVASLLVYSIYRSRDINKFKVSPDMWGVIERACKSSSKRAMNIEDFVEKFKKKVYCSSIKPKYLSNHKELSDIRIMKQDGSIMSLESTKKDFGIEIINNCNQKEVLKQLYRHSAFVILYVRDRMEREKELIKIGQLIENSEVEENEN